MSMMFVFRRLRYALLVLALLPVWAHADFPPEERPNIRPGRYYGTITLTFEQFMEDFEGRDPHERGNANVYLYGIADATKGKEWCGRVKTMEFLNHVSDQLSKLDKSVYNDKRAADVITLVLRNHRPCTKKGETK